MTCGQDFAAWLSVLRKSQFAGGDTLCHAEVCSVSKTCAQKGTIIWSNASPSSSDKTRFYFGGVGGRRMLGKNKKQIILSPSHNLVLHIEF